MDPAEDAQHQEHAPQPKPSSHSNHIRSRITVVCAECKRLKLRCDRRTPCASCVKRDTLDRCKYSQAATEKVDLQSVNNRVIALEARVALLSSTCTVPRPSLSHDRSLLATGNSGSSLAISLDDVTSVWLSRLNCTPNSKLKLETAPVELPTVDLLPTSLFPPISAFHTSSSSLEPPSVTVQLMSKLPAAPDMCQRLLAALEDTLAMHPCFNFPYFQTRIQNMFVWAKEFESLSASDKFPNSGGSRAPMFSKPTLSFFAAAAAAFALGALVSQTTNAGGDEQQTSFGNASRSSDSPCSPAALLALSEQSLAVFEKAYNYDLDYLVAIILQVIFLLHDGKPRLVHTLFPLVGKMINIARIMGLGTDPDDFPGTYCLFEAETRRRIWWDIFYYDLFISDCMGHQPLIADNSFTTKLPAEVDEQQFSPSSTSLPVPQGSCETSNIYFGLKCRLAQLVKNLKKRMFMDPLSDSDSFELSMEEAVEYESKIAQFTADLPPEYRVNLDVSREQTANDLYPSLLLAQSCELSIIVNRLIITLYLPFLKANPVNPPHQASLATVNAAHKIVQSMKVWVLGKSQGTGRDREMWSSFGVYYEYGRLLFDAAVVCASMSIDFHDSAFSQCVKDDVDAALDIMKEMEKTRRGTSGKRAFPAGTGASGRLEGNVSEDIAIVEMLKKKAQTARVGQTLKRKRQDTERDVLFTGFRIPFVGAAVASTASCTPGQHPTSQQPSFTSPTTARPRSDSPSEKIKVEGTKNDPTLDLLKRSKDKPLDKGKDMELEKNIVVKSKDKDKGKASKYPTYGIRIRPGIEPPYARGRTPSISPSTTMTSNITGPPSRGSMQSSVSEGAFSPSYPPTPKPMLPPPPSSTIGPPTPMQAENQSGYFSTSSFAHDNLAPMQDAGSQSSMSGSFSDVSRSASASRKFGPQDYAGNPQKTFFDQPYESTSQSTSPTSAQPTPPFSAMSHSSQYGSLSQPQSDFYMDNCDSSNSYVGLSMTRSDVSSTGFGMNTVDQQRPSSSHSNTAYMLHDKIMFAMTANDPASSNIGTTRFKGSERINESRMEISTDQEWISPSPSSAHGVRDPYWGFKIHPE